MRFLEVAINAQKQEGFFGSKTPINNMEIAQARAFEATERTSSKF
jgi:hypothetical protein